MANPPYGDSSKDPICPTYAAGTISLTSSGAGVAKGSGGGEFNNDNAAPGSANGYVNQFASITVGSFNNGWANGYLSQSKTPVFASGLASFGNTGLQS